MTDSRSGPEHVDFTSIYSDDAIKARVAEVLDSKRYVKGPLAEQFEEAFANYCGTNHAVAVNSGTSALLLALKALDIGSGDEVLVPAHTYFATVSPVLELGARPIFVDIDPETYTMSPSALSDKLATAEQPAVVMVTHMHGQPADMDGIKAAMEGYDVRLVEDAAQAHGARYHGQRVGSFGDLACFSFYPSKNMTVGGDGGMVTTDDESYARAVKQFRNHGRDEEGRHVRLGLNYRMDETNAAIGIEQLGHLDDWNTARQQAAAVYDEQLASVNDVVLPETRDDRTHVYHHYPIQVPDRADFRDALGNTGIDTAVHYERAVHTHPAVADRVGDVTRPQAERLCERIVSLPMHPRITDEELTYVCETITEYYQ